MVIGIFWIIIFCLFSVIADGIVRYITLYSDITSSQLLFIRCLFATILLLPFVIKDKSIIISKKTCKIYFLRGIFAFASVWIWFYILKFTDFTALIAIGFISPLITSILAIIFLKEK